MKYHVITIGKIKEKYLTAGIDEFLKRLRPYGQVELTVLPGVGVEVVRVVPATAMRVGRGGVTMAIGDVFVGQPVEQRPHLGLNVYHRVTISQMPCAI